ncbi:phosphatase PAP2 family protein [Bradyrhizobium mercantei]|uniref:phosphatase PAP2 family protein n=1 Tax=Bradyrhizobium mercantei TaxID=1904807 RepID=UPI00097758C1|nr:phosphatase PAP2 family protein [Bradyrhizobium mercantei]
MDIAVAKRLLQLNWILIAAILAVFLCALLLTDFRVRASGYLIVAGVAGFHAAFGYRNMRSASSDPRVYATLSVLPQIVLIAVLVASLGYIAASANLPMQDANLLAFDRLLGLDFRAYLDFVNDRPALIGVLARTYNSIWAQLFGVLILLSMVGQCRRAAELVLAFTTGLIVTTGISTLVPATGVYGTLGLLPADYSHIDPSVYYDTLRELPLVRNGTTRLLDAFELGPLLTFPSFHAVSAALYMWACWPIRWLRGVGLIWNAVMLAATPIGGGHYFADVMAGLAVAAASIYAVNRLSARLTPAEHARPKLLLQLSPAAT